MKIVAPNIELYDTIDADSIVKKVEYAARTCYQSYDRSADSDPKEFIKRAIARGHESILEHVQLTFKVTCSRDILAQWTRHRLASYSVESQRYCNYTKEKFDGVKFILPANLNGKLCNSITRFYKKAERAYNKLIEMGAKPEQARAVLPNGTKTEFVWSANLREIRHFIKLRTSSGAQEDIKLLANQLVNILNENDLEIFVEDLI